MGSKNDDEIPYNHSLKVVNHQKLHYILSLHIESSNLESDEVLHTKSPFPDGKKTKRQQNQCFEIARM